MAIFNSYVSLPEGIHDIIIFNLQVAEKLRLFSLPSPALVDLKSLHRCGHRAEGGVSHQCINGFYMGFTYQINRTNGYKWVI